jgi:hypothetical protein
MAHEKFWRKSCRAFYVWHEGQQVWLGKYEQEVDDNLKRLRDGLPVVRPQRRKAAPKATTPTVPTIVDQFLDYVKANRERYSPNARRLICLAAGSWSYDVSSQRLQELCGLRVSDTTIRECELDGRVLRCRQESRTCRVRCRS